MLTIKCQSEYSDKLTVSPDLGTGDTLIVTVYEEHHAQGDYDSMCMALSRTTARRLGEELLRWVNCEGCESDVSGAIS